MRRAGLLLHPTSLPGRFGVGDIGPGAEAFVEWAVTAGIGLWQVLPLTPPGEGSSPYTALSAFAGNPLLISPERLVEDGLLSGEAIASVPPFPAGRVDFAAVAAWKDGLLRLAWERFGRDGSPALRDRLRDFAADPLHAAWLADWELYRALKELHGGAPWHAWPAPLARRDPVVLAEARRDLLAETGYHRFVQFLFFDQWARLRAAAARRGIQLIGDLPIYVAHDSAEVWAHQELFDLDAEGQPRYVAGVPADYFSSTGQRWGNPLYRWDRLAADGYAWWVERLRANLELTDLVRVDHFRAFAAYWRVPASAPTALEGEWVAGPGIALFDALRQALGGLPILAEDLGTITADVEALRQQAGLPGMKVLQFAFDEEDSSHLPHHHPPRSAVYTGTHDNDTTVGWFAGLDEAARRRFADYLGRDGEGPHWQLIRAAYTSPSELAVVPLQDVLGLGSEARMNLPGRAEGNWAWRVPPGLPRGDEAERLRRLAGVAGRHPRGAAAGGHRADLRQNRPMADDVERIRSGSPFEERYGFCRALRRGRRIEVAGTAPIPRPGEPLAGDAYLQMLRCGEIAAEALARLGARPEHVVRTRMFITDPADADEVGRAHRELFGGAPPVATMVVTRLLDPRWKVELEVEAELTASDEVP